MKVYMVINKFKTIEMIHIKLKLYRIIRCGKNQKITNILSHQITYIKKKIFIVPTKLGKAMEIQLKVITWEEINKYKMRLIENKRN